MTEHCQYCWRDYEPSKSHTCMVLTSAEELLKLRAIARAAEAYVMVKDEKNALLTVGPTAHWRRIIAAEDALRAALGRGEVGR